MNLRYKFISRSKASIMTIWAYLSDDTLADDGYEVGISYCAKPVRNN